MVGNHNVGIFLNKTCRHVYQKLFHLVQWETSEYLIGDSEYFHNTKFHEFTVKIQQKYFVYIGVIHKDICTETEEKTFIIPDV